MVGYGYPDESTILCTLRCSDVTNDVAATLWQRCLNIVDVDSTSLQRRMPAASVDERFSL